MHSKLVFSAIPQQNSITNLLFYTLSFRSTKAFHAWLQKRPHFPMPPFLKSLDDPGEKKQPFVVPSDYVLKEKASVASAQDLALPISEFSLELKEVLSKLLND